MRPRDLIFPFIIIPLGIAFAAACLFFWLSGERNAHLLKAKMKLGAILLTFTFFTSCGGPPVVTCYKPAPPDNSVYLTSENEISIGDTIKANIYNPTFSRFDWTLTPIVEKDSIQEYRGEFNKEASGAQFTNGQFLLPTIGFPAGAYEFRIKGISDTGNQGTATLIQSTIVLK